MINVFIGFDKNEQSAWHVLAHSIIANSSVPVSITPLRRENMPWFKRPRGPYDSTDFAITRFLVPCLSDYAGFSVFMDCDMVCLGDIAELGNYMTVSHRWSRAVHVVKHDYIPAKERKFLDQPQTKYARKNWSSVMVFSNAMCRALTPEYVSQAHGLDLHQFKWCDNDKIGSLPKSWNYLVGEENQCEAHEAKLIHFTNGTPCFPEYEHCEFADLWRVYKSEVDWATKRGIAIQAAA